MLLGVSQVTQWLAAEFADALLALDDVLNTEELISPWHSMRSTCSTTVASSTF
jgi:hypothetical protein